MSQTICVLFQFKDVSLNLDNPVPWRNVICTIESRLQVQQLGMHAYYLLQLLPLHLAKYTGWSKCV